MLYPAASLFLSYQHVFYIGLWYYLRIGSCDMLIDCGVGSVSNYSLYLMQKHRTQCTLTPAPNIPLTNDITPHFELLPYLYPLQLIPPQYFLIPILLHHILIPIGLLTPLPIHLNIPESQQHNQNSNISMRWLFD